MGVTISPLFKEDNLLARGGGASFIEISFKLNSESS